MKSKNINIYDSIDLANTKLALKYEKNKQNIQMSVIEL